MEIWRDIIGYEGFYQVSNLGNVKSLPRKITQFNNGTKTLTFYKGKILKPQKRGNYLIVHLTKKGKQKWLFIHRLVAQAFIEQKEGCNIVNHLDNNPSNNKAENLEWTTYKGNMQYASKQGRIHCNSNNLKKAQESRKRAVIGKKDNKEYYFSSIAEARRKLNLSNHISECCNKVYGYTKCGGYEWRYADE